MASPKPYSKSPKRPTRIDKSTAQRIAETLLLFAPAPIRSIASTPLGSKIFLTVATGLLTTGMLSIDWENGMPKIQWHRENAQQAKDQITQDLQQQGVQWQQTANGPVVSHNGQQYPVPVQNLPGYQQFNQAQGYPPPPQYSNPNGYPTAFQQPVLPNGNPNGNWYPPPQQGQPLPPHMQPPPNMVLPPNMQNGPYYPQNPQQLPPGAYSAGGGNVYPPGYVR